MLRDPLALPWYRQTWPWLLMAGPAVVVMAGVVTVWLAIVSNDGLVADDYYKQGLAVNQRLYRDHQASNLGLSANLMRSGDAVRLLLAAHESISMPAELAIKFSHPTRSGRDQTVKMSMESPGFYTGQLSESLVGRWIVTIEDPEMKWRLHAEWLADGGETLRLSAGK